MDIGAWVDLLVARGSKRVVLQGHSHGALKVTYYLYKAQDHNVVGLILLSPSDDFGCQRDRIGDRFDEALAAAAEMIRDGKGMNLMPAEYFHYPVSAITYRDIFQKDSGLDMFNLSRTDTSEFPEVESVRVPTLVIVGSVDEAFLGTPQAYLSDLKGYMSGAPSFTGCVIEGAPHSYLHFERQLADRIGGWLDTELKR